MSKIIGLLLLLSLLFSGCGSLAFPTSTTTDKNLILKPCTVGGVEAKCGYLHVPEDRSHPDGRILELFTVIVPAQGPSSEPDPLFYIVGGPGVPATMPDIVANAHHNIFSQVNAKRDLVFLDQRGTNSTHRLACAAIPDEVANGGQQQMNDWIKNCLARLDGDPRFYTTAVAMRDLDDARAALGYNKINIYGISYGAAAAQVYMRMFPEHVRAVVLDHGTALDLPFRYMLPRASQSALDQVFTYCEQDEKCHATYPDIRSDWKEVFDRLAKGPVTTSFIASGYDTPATISLEGLAEGLHQFMYNGSYGEIPFLIHTLATNEDWTSIAKSYYEQHGSGSSNNDLLLMQYMIFCFEPAWGTQPDQAAQFSSGSYYLTQEVQILQSQQKICDALPKPDPSLIYGPGKTAPLSALMFNSLLDPQNPPSNMDVALQEFTKSQVVVEPTEGHEPFVNHECRWDIIARYIEKGSADGLDTSCMKNQKPSFISGN